jgi:hypothetical protein
LVLESGRVRREIVCECGTVLIVLGSDRYRAGSRAAGRRRPSRQHWMRSRAMLFSARRPHPVDALHRVRAGGRRSKGLDRRAAG